MQDIREKLIDLLTGYSLDTYEDVQYVADALIAKSVVPVVRCKDCIQYEPCESGKDFCCFHAIGIVPDDFCSYGERKDGEGNA